MRTAEVPTNRGQKRIHHLLRVMVRGTLRRHLTRRANRAPAGGTRDTMSWVRGPVRLLLGGETHRPTFFSVSDFYVIMRNPTARVLTPAAFFSGFFRVRSSPRF